MSTTNPLKSIRESLGWTQQQMADELDISVRTYVDQESVLEPKRVYVLAAQQLRARTQAVGPDKPLPFDEETRAQASAALHYAQALFGAVHRLGKVAGIDLLLQEEADSLERRAHQPAETAEDRIRRRASWLAKEALETNLTFGV